MLLTQHRRYRPQYLALILLQQIGHGTMIHPYLSFSKSGRVPPSVYAGLGSLDSGQPDILVSYKLVKHSESIGTTPLTNHQNIRLPTPFLHRLFDWNSRTNTGHECGPTAVPAK